MSSSLSKATRAAYLRFFPRQFGTAEHTPSVGLQYNDKNLRQLEPEREVGSREWAARYERGSRDFAHHTEFLFLKQGADIARGMWWKVRDAISQHFERINLRKKCLKFVLQD